MTALGTSCPIPARTAARRTDGGVMRGQQTVLLLEDNDPLRAVLIDVLDGEGYRVLGAANADEALGAIGAAGEVLDLLVADVEVPGMSGAALARLVRTVHPSLAVVLMSGHQSAAVDARALQALAATFLAKPFTPSQLLATVRSSLEARRQACCVRPAIGVGPT